MANSSQLPSGFTNLNQIVAANQSPQLGNTLQQGVQKGVSGLQSNLQQAQNQFQTGVNAANLNTAANQQYVQNTIGSIVNPQAGSPLASYAPPAAQGPAQQTTDSSTAPPPVVNNMVQAPSTTQKTTGTVNALSTPTTPTVSTTSATPPTAAAITSTPTAAAGSFGVSTPTSGATAAPTLGMPTAGDLSQFSNFIQGGYNGPTQLNNLSTLQAQAQNLQQQGQNVTTPGGLQNLLQQYVGGPNYNQGEQNLDAVLLGQTATPQLKAIAQLTQGLANQPTQAAQQAAGLAQATATGNQQMSQYVQNQLAAAQNPIMQQLQSQITDANQQNTSNQTLASQIYGLLNNPLSPNVTHIIPGSSVTNSSPRGGPVTTTTAPKIINSNGYQLNPGQYAAPTTANAAAIDALNAAASNGLLNAGQISAITQLIPQLTSGGNNLQSALQKAFNDPFANGSSVQDPTLQQVANEQQAAQLNALQQLGGQQQQFGTYGGFTPTAASFNLSSLPDFQGLTPQQQAAAASTPATPWYEMLGGPATIPIQGSGAALSSALSGDAQAPQAGFQAMAPATQMAGLQAALNNAGLGGLLPTGNTPFGGSSASVGNQIGSFFGFSKGGTVPASSYPNIHKLLNRK